MQLGSYNSTRHVAILGDPTLRMNIFSPPANVQAVQPDTNTVVLTWAATLDPLAQYHVFRASSTNGPFITRLNSQPISGASFTNTGLPSGSKVYQVRAVKLIQTGSGSYTNLSQGTRTSVVY